MDRFLKNINTNTNPTVLVPAKVNTKDASRSVDTQSKPKSTLDSPGSKPQASKAVAATTAAETSRVAKDSSAPTAKVDSGLVNMTFDHFLSIAHHPIPARTLPSSS